MRHSNPVKTHRRRDLTGGSDRRDLAIRPERDAVAAFFGVHPALLTALDPRLVAVMAYRIQGDRRHWSESAAALLSVPSSPGSLPHQAA